MTLFASTIMSSLSVLGTYTILDRKIVNYIFYIMVLAHVSNNMPSHIC